MASATAQRLVNDHGFLKTSNHGGQELHMSTTILEQQLQQWEEENHMQWGISKTQPAFGLRWDELLPLKDDDKKSKFDDKKKSKLEDYDKEQQLQQQNHIVRGILINQPGFGLGLEEWSSFKDDDNKKSKLEGYDKKTSKLEDNDEKQQLQQREEKNPAVWDTLIHQSAFLRELEDWSSDYDKKKSKLEDSDKKTSKLEDNDAKQKSKLEDLDEKTSELEDCDEKQQLQQQKEENPMAWDTLINQPAFVQELEEWSSFKDDDKEWKLEDCEAKQQLQQREEEHPMVWDILVNQPAFGPELEDWSLFKDDDKKEFKWEDYDKEKPISVKDYKNLTEEQLLYHFRNMKFRPFTNEERVEYYERIGKSEGFDVGDFPDTIDARDMFIQPLAIQLFNSEYKTWKVLENASKLALDVYEENKKTKYQFADLVKVNHCGCRAKEYFITFQAKHVDGSAPKNFQSQVNVYKGDIRVHFCRPEAVF